jgi:hypothetical protein
MKYLSSQVIRAGAAVLGATLCSFALAAVAMAQMGPSRLTQKVQSADAARYAALWDRQSGPAQQARHGLTSAQYQQTFDALGAQGYRLVQVNGYGVGGQARYAAIWERRQGPAWVARHGLTGAQYQQAFDTYTQQGYRVIDVSGYNVGAQVLYAAIWERGQGPAWIARHGLTSAQYQQAFDTFAAQGYRLIDVSGYDAGGQARYAAIWVQRQGPAWAARHGLTSAQYQQAFDTYAAQGYRLVNLSAYKVGGQARFAAIWERREGTPWVARHGLNSAQYQQQFNTFGQQGYRLTRVSGYAG